MTMGITAVLRVLVVALTLAPSAAWAQEPAQTPFEPMSGQAGKDVVWVPTPMETVEKMLDLAQVTPDDFVVDLGSGDGRNVIAAARRGAQALGVEYNPEMVELSRRLAKEAGVAERASFVQGDMYEADISKASVLALFLLPTNLDRLRDKFLALKPGTRIVLNTFGIDGWEPDVKETVTDCTSWCTTFLLIVPARVEGTWQFRDGRLRLSQQFQMISGDVMSGGSATAIAAGRLRGDHIAFTVEGTEYTGRVQGDRIEGTMTAAGREQKWTAVREP